MKTNLKKEGKMKKGDIIEIYQDPWTKKKIEGKAKLVKRFIEARQKNELEYWEVEFLSDGAIVNRWVG
jgi:hypothetical protein